MYFCFPKYVWAGVEIMRPTNKHKVQMSPPNKLEIPPSFSLDVVAVATERLAQRKGLLPTAAYIKASKFLSKITKIIL